MHGKRESVIHRKELKIYSIIINYKSRFTQFGVLVSVLQSSVLLFPSHHADVTSFSEFLCEEFVQVDALIITTYVSLTILFFSNLICA